MEKSLPHDITENILSRLPVKSLLRFKSVPKSWEATISDDPEFARIHLRRQFKNSDIRYLLMDYPHQIGDSHVVKFEYYKDEIELVSTVEFPWDNSFKFLCYCDGLVLMGQCCWNQRRTYALWNPSSRSYKEFRCPHPIVKDQEIVSGLYYDPLLNDYKVIITDMKHYTVFHCRNESWTEMKETEHDLHGKVESSKGVSLDGNFYWILNIIRREDDHGSFVPVNEMICFDSRTEKFKKVAMPYGLQYTEPFNLHILEGNLYLSIESNYKFWQVVFVKGEIDQEDSWIKVYDDQLPSYWDRCRAYSLCLPDKDVILFHVHTLDFLVICDSILFWGNRYVLSTRH